MPAMAMLGASMMQGRFSMQQAGRDQGTMQLLGRPLFDLAGLMGGHQQIMDAPASSSGTVSSGGKTRIKYRDRKGRIAIAIVDHDIGLSELDCVIGHGARIISREPLSAWTPRNERRNEQSDSDE